MKSLNHIFLENIKLTQSEAGALRALGMFKGRQELFLIQSPEVLKTLKDRAMIESTESSNRIEGVIAPKDRIEEIVHKNSAPKNRSEQEIAGYRDALELIYESGKQMSFTCNVILQLHSILYRHIPNQGGRWKSADNQIREIDRATNTYRIRFIPTSAFDTPKAMADLEEYYKYATSEILFEPLIIIPLAILDFLCIHPFLDGNGRTSRLLTTMLLDHYGYDVSRYISLERIFEQTKESYYEFLEKSSVNWHTSQHDPMPWLRYFWGVITAAYKEFEERVSAVKDPSAVKTEMIKSAIRRKIGSFAISDIEKECPSISRVFIKQVISRLKEEGHLSLQGKGRGSKWLASEKFKYEGK